MIRSEFLSTVGWASNFDACDVSGKVRIQRVSLQVPEGSEGEDVFVLGALPPGHTVFLGDMSRLYVRNPQTKLKTTVKYSVRLGSYTEPAGLSVKANAQETLLASEQSLKGVQSIPIKNGLRKHKAVQATEVILSTSEPLPAGTEIEGYLAYSHD